MRKKIILAITIFIILIFVFLFRVSIYNIIGEFKINISIKDKEDDDYVLLFMEEEWLGKFYTGEYLQIYLNDRKIVYSYTNMKKLSFVLGSDVHYKKNKIKQLQDSDVETIQRLLKKGKDRSLNNEFKGGIGKVSIIGINEKKQIVLDDSQASELFEILERVKK